VVICYWSDVLEMVWVILMLVAVGMFCLQGYFDELVAVEWYDKMMILYEHQNHPNHFQNITPIANHHENSSIIE
jgi:hypothetical protein